MVQIINFNYPLTVVYSIYSYLCIIIIIRELGAVPAKSLNMDQVLEKLREPFLQAEFDLQDIVEYRERLEMWIEDRFKYKPIIIEGKHYSFEEVYEEGYENIRAKKIARINRDIILCEASIQSNLHILN